MRAVFVDSNILIYSQDATILKNRVRLWTGLKFSGEPDRKDQFPSPARSLCERHPEGAKATSHGAGTDSRPPIP